MAPLGFVEKRVCKRMHRLVMALVETVQNFFLVLLPFHPSFLLIVDVLCDPRAQGPNCQDSTQPAILPSAPK